MQSLSGLSMDQDRVLVESLKCVHSKATEAIYPNWEDHWIVNDLEDTDLSYKVFCNPDISVQTLSAEGRFLAAIQKDGNITLLFTVGKKQKFPLCSNVSCSKQTKCICFKKYKKLLEEHDGSEDEEADYYWNRRTRTKPDVINHFLSSISVEDHNRRHGYNRTKIEYPIKRSIEIQNKFLDRVDGVFNLPEIIKPDYDENFVCQHRNQ